MRYNISVEKQGEIYKGKIAAMVSGGVDSMVMLDVLLKCGADVLVAHVNHGIRAEADGDCAFVQDYCNQKNVPFVKFLFDIPSMAALSGRSIETEARLARRKVVDELISSGKVDKAAFAHHADDNAETVLMHILRGSGVDGLKGIEPSQRILRPLIDMTRQEIVEYARKNGIPYVEDKTNLDSAYTRNFIRLEVLPLIKTRYPAAVEALNRLARNAAQTIECLDSQLDTSLITEANGEVRLSVHALTLPLSARYVITAAKKLMPVDVTRAHIQNVLKLAGSQNGSVAELAGGLKAYREYDHITFCFDRQSVDFCVPFFKGKTQIGGTVISVSEVEPKVIKGETIIRSPLPDGCVFRRRREGDRFVAYGGKSKSLKKYLIDKKIPSRLRDQLVCLCDGSEVIAVVGVEVSDKYKLTASTTTAYLIRQEELV